MTNELLEQRVQMLERIISIYETQLYETNVQLKYALMPKSLGTRNAPGEIVKKVFTEIDMNINKMDSRQIQDVFEHEAPATESISSFIVKLIDKSGISLKGQNITYLQDDGKLTTTSMNEFVTLVCGQLYTHCHPIIQRLSEYAEDEYDETNDALDNTRISNVVLLKSNNDIAKLTKKIMSKLR